MLSSDDNPLVRKLSASPPEIFGRKNPVLFEFRDIC